MSMHVRQITGNIIPKQSGNTKDSHGRTWRAVISWEDWETHIETLPKKGPAMAQK